MATYSRRSSAVVSPWTSCCWTVRRDLPDQLVDDLVALDQLLRRVAIAGQQGVGGAGDALADQREDLGEQAVDLVGLGHGPRPERLLRDERSDLQGVVLGFDLLRDRFRAATELERHPRHAIGSVPG